MRQYPVIYNQRDSLWASHPVGDGVDGATIALYGCFITAWASKAGYYGHPITPPSLNDRFVQQHLFFEGDLVSSDADLQTVFPDIRYLQTDHYEKIPADLGQLKRLSDDPTITVTLEIDLGAGNTHFVELHWCDGTTVQIYNPYYGSDEDFRLHYGDPAGNILKYVVYQGTPVTASVPVPSETFDRLVHNSTQWDGCCDYFTLPHNSDFGEVKTSVDRLKQNLADAEKDAKNASDSASALADQIKKTSEDDSGLAERNLAIGKQLGQTNADLQALYKATGTEPPIQNAIAAFQTLKQQDDQAVKEYETLGKALEQNAITDAPQPKPSWLQSLRRWLGW
jgi:hypothetical protein